MRIDLNADVGESFGVWHFGDDTGLLPHLTSANVACGFHAGDPSTVLRTVAAAARLGVRIGAQVSYPDRVGFGRRAMDVDAADLYADVLYQVGALQGLCHAVGAVVAYVKPHGALYHRTASDPHQAAALVDAVAVCELPLLHLPQGAHADAATRGGVQLIREGFADRAYVGEVGASALVPRTELGAVITSPEAAAAQVLALARSGRVDSLCVHSDTPGAAQIAAAVRRVLDAAGYDVAAFT